MTTKTRLIILAVIFLAGFVLSASLVYSFDGDKAKLRKITQLEETITRLEDMQRKSHEQAKSCREIIIPGSQESWAQADVEIKKAQKSIQDVKQELF